VFDERFNSPSKELVWLKDDQEFLSSLKCLNAQIRSCDDVCADTMICFVCSVDVQSHRDFRN
jgi:hypothetical protein